MQLEKAERLRNEMGDKPCNHENIDKEYIKGMGTGDYVCIRCGKNFLSREK